MPERNSFGFFGRTKVRGHRAIGEATVEALAKKYQVPVVPLAELPDLMRAAGDFVEGA